MSAATVAEQKRELRRQALRDRPTRAPRSAPIVDALEGFLSDLGTGWVVLFDALPGEPDLSPLLERMPEQPFALTRTPAEGRILTVHSARADREFHRFGYTQPLADAPQIPDADLVAVCVPGLVFDGGGGRLGFGAGYYDRFLSRLSPQVARIGVTDGQLVEHVPSADHDVPMTHLVGDFGVRAVPFDRTTPRR